MGKKEKLSLEELLEHALVKEEDKPHEVPNNWVWVRLGTVCRLENGYAFKSDDYRSKGIPLIRISNINGYLVDISESVYIDQNDIDRKFLVNSGDLLIAMSGATTGKTGIYEYEFPAWQNQRIGNLKILYRDILNDKYRNYYIMNRQQNILNKAYGGAQPNISGKMIEDLCCPLPPLPEQQRIVALIESLFKKLDRAKELAQNVLESFEKRKSAILHKAFAGELTRKWRDENGVDSDKDWEEKKLKDICSKITDGTHKSPKNFDTGEYMYVTAKNIKEYGLNLKNITYISEEIHKEIYRRCNVEYGDVLFIKDGATTGIATVNTLKEEFSLLSSVALLKPNKQILDSKYLAYNLNSFETKSKMLSNMTGSAITRLTLNKIQQSIIRIPLIAEQQEIVCILDNLLENEQKAKELCDVIDKIDQMKKVILARAFRGELGTNKPEEESALELLKEVLKEKA